MVPSIETARLRLRALDAKDLDEHAAILADPVVVRHLGGTPHAREEAWRRMLAAAACWAMLGYGYWAVERKEDGRYLGLIGFADFKRDLTPSIEGLPEIGWILGAHAHGQGYASEAVAAAIEWADEALEAREIVAIIDHANAGSIRVAEKAGFTVREEAQYRTAPILLFRRIASD
jgi:RimJ/RimL family protein N-acetyltransferase